MEDLEIIPTSDGSPTLRNNQLNETYHSVHGAMQESRYVFIANGLEYFRKQGQAKYVFILEIGFGTGLNALLALQYAAHHNVAIHYTTLEPFPLIEMVWSKLHYGSDRDQFALIHRASWDREAPLTPTFTLQKYMISLEAAELKNGFDVIFFDAFAPSVQPGLWEYPMLEKVVKTMKPGGVFVTYSAKGQLKRDLRSLGLQVETLPGPPGKNEMVRGVMPEL